LGKLVVGVGEAWINLDGIAVLNGRFAIFAPLEVALATLEIFLLAP